MSLVKKNKFHILLAISLLELLGIAFFLVHKPTNNQPGSETEYKTSSYNIFYPSSWMVESKNPLTLKPSSKSYPFLTLQSDRLGHQREKESVYHALGFRSESITVDSILGKKLTGTLPIKNSDGKITRSPIRQTVIFLEKGNTSYTIIYEYEGSDVVDSEEATFSKIISSIKLTH